MPVIKQCKYNCTYLLFPRWSLLTHPWPLMQAGIWQLLVDKVCWCKRTIFCIALFPSSLLWYGEQAAKEQNIKSKMRQEKRSSLDPPPRPQCTGPCWFFWWVVGLLEDGAVPLLQAVVDKCILAASFRKSLTGKKDGQWFQKCKAQIKLIYLRLEVTETLINCHFMKITQLI